jgi:hypothetical protein
MAGSTTSTLPMFNNLLENDEIVLLYIVSTYYEYEFVVAP